MAVGVLVVLNAAVHDFAGSAAGSPVRLAEAADPAGGRSTPAFGGGSAASATDVAAPGIQPFGASGSQTAPATGELGPRSASPPAVAVALTASELRACPPTTTACVDPSRDVAWLQRGGAVIYGPVRIEPGRPGHRTPLGTFTVSWKTRYTTSNIYHEPMPYAVFFAPGGVAFHEGSLTSPSHGCVHLLAPAAVKFFQTLEPGNRVTVL